MELTQEAIEQIKAEVTREIDSQERMLAPAGISSATICENKELIMSFLQVLVGVLPGMLGKIVGGVVITAAQAWFSAKKC